jgi:hypothetical protein
VNISSDEQSEFSRDGQCDIGTSLLDHNSNGRLSSLCPSLLQTTVAMGGFCLSLLCYHCSNAVLVTGQMSVATMPYDLLPQCMFVVVQ